MYKISVPKREIFGEVLGFYPRKMDLYRQNRAKNISFGDIKKFYSAKTG